MSNETEQSLEAGMPAGGYQKMVLQPRNSEDCSTVIWGSGNTVNVDAGSNLLLMVVALTFVAMLIGYGIHKISGGLFSSFAQVARRLGKNDAAGMDKRNFVQPCVGIRSRNSAAGVIASRDAPTQMYS